MWFTCNRFDDESSFVVFSTNVAVGQFDRFALGSSVFCECFKGRAFSWFPCGILLLRGWPRGELFHGLFGFLEGCGARAWIGSW